MVRGPQFEKRCSRWYSTVLLPCVTSLTRHYHKNRITERCCMLNTFILAAISQAEWLKMRTALFLVITQRVVVIYRRFRTTCRSHLQGSRIQKAFLVGKGFFLILSFKKLFKFLTLKDGTRQVVPKRRQEVTTTRCVITQKSDVLKQVKFELMFFCPCIVNWLYINYQLDALTIIYS